jgi:hypothetical protein
MTTIWGPLGWMSIHSISTIYPEKPSEADKQILKRYIDLFRDTISCPHCQSHFSRILNNYTQEHPEWANSKFDFFLFVVRAHNTVNNRLSKPKPGTVQECLDTYKRNTQITPGIVYRQKYLEYLTRNWSREMSGESFMRLSQVREMRRITEEYWNRRTDESTSTFNMGANVLALINEHGPGGPPSAPGSLSYAANNMVKIGFRGGKLRLKL